ncbi:MAG: MBL fold metallo-hydrolase [Desulfobacterium sp.]
MPGVEQIKILEKEKVFSPDEFKKDPNKRMIFWRTLMAQYEYNDNHFFVLSLADQNYIDTIITSNYDCLFEDCIEKEFPDWILKDSDKTYSPIKTFQNNKTLVKIHGDIISSDIENFQLLELTQGVSGSKDHWQTLFDKTKDKGERWLWVIGYAGKPKDDAYKYIKESVKQGHINKIVWMFLEKEDIPEHIKNDLKTVVEFIPIQNAQKFFLSLNKALSIHPSQATLPTPKDNSQPEKVERVREAFAIADKTIELLKMVDPEIIKDIEEAEMKFDALLRPGQELKKGSELFVLRRYNSYTPILPSNGENRHEHSKGGGYFLNCNGTGIIIDPGYDFVENFIKCEHQPKTFLKFNNIHAICITHAHNDHYGELDAIQNLIFQYNKRIEMNKQLYGLLKRIINLIEVNGSIIADNGKISTQKEQIKNKIKEITHDRPYFQIAKTAMELLEEQNPDKVKSQYLREIIAEVEMAGYGITKLNLFISRSALKAIDGLIPLEKNCFDTVQILNPGEKIKYGNITICATQAKHMDLYSKSHAVGLIFSFDISGEIFKIGFTGDTGYFSGLGNLFRECQLLIPHLGSIKPKELSIYNNSNSSVNTSQQSTKLMLNENLYESYFPPLFGKDKHTAFYANHLGILGLSTLIATLKARSDNKLKMVVISKYGEEMRTFRNKITQDLAKLFENESPPLQIITGDIGLKIDLKMVMNDHWTITETCDENGIITYKYNK